MEHYQNDFDHEQINPKNSLAQYIQSHPFQYLKQMNSIFNTCNKSSSKFKDYSSASMVKLPWKKFKIANIPKCFQNNYNQEKKQTIFAKQEYNQNDQQEKKFWKEHQQILKRYRTIKKQEPKIHSITNKSNIHQKQNNLNQGKLCSFQDLSKNLSESQSQKIKNDKNQILQRVLGNNKKNILLKKIIGKGKTIEYDGAKMQEEVIQKLKTLNSVSNISYRAKTANPSSKIYNKNITGKNNHNIRRPGINQSLQGVYFNYQSRVKEGQYLEYNLEQQLLQRYKKKIKQIDCSLSEKNVKKTGQILREMQRIANESNQNF